MTDPQIDYHITVGDWGKILTATLLDAHREPVDLTDAQTVKLRCAKNARSVPLFVGDCVPDPDQATNPGVVTYTFAMGQADTPGYYRLQFVVTWVNKRVTFPTEALTFEIRDELLTA